MISIVTTFKPFKDHFRIIQLNALRSWLRFCPPCEVIVLGNEDGVAEVAEEHGIKHIPQVERNKFGTPLLNSILECARRASRNEIICYINGDIILLGDLIRSVSIVKSTFHHFLITAKRYNIDLESLIDFSSPSWFTYIQEVMLKQKVRKSGIDVFIFPKSLFCDAPAFAVGRFLWPRWFIYKAFRMNIPYIDGTDALLPIHQNHDYSHIKDPRVRINLGYTKGIGGEKAFGEEYLVNKRLAGVARFFSDKDYNYKLTKERVKKRISFRYAMGRVVKAPLIYPSLSSLLNAAYTIAKTSRVMRRFLNNTMILLTKIFN